MHSPSDAPLPNDDAPLDHDGLAVSEGVVGADGFDGGTAVLDAPRWMPPTQEVALDPELVAILCGDPFEGASAEDDASGDEDGDEREDASDLVDAPDAQDAPVGGDDADEPEDDDLAADADPAEFVRPAAALLFASPEALSTRRLADLLGTKPKVAALTLAALGERLGTSGLPFVVCEVSGGWRLFTDPEMAEVVQRLDSSRRTEKISPAGLETLAIIAYRQPVTKAEIEAIRGVQAGPMLRTLVDRGLVKVTGRADQPGSPLLYGTTADFLDRFGLASLDDLPRDGELARD